jgi:subtilase family serine protease
MTLGKVSRLFASLACALACLSSGSILHAQQLASSPRIVESVDESRLTILKGNTRPEARPENDRGHVASNLVMGDLILVLRRSPDRQAAFEALLAAQQDPASPQFHHWLTPAEIGQKYGPAQADIATVTHWLQNHGFTVDQVSNDHLAITFSGMASQVESTFHTEIHNLQVKGESHIANMSDPQIPEALTPVVVGVKALHNFFPRPLHHLGSQVRRDSSTGKWERIPNSGVRSASGTGAASGRNSKALVAPEFGTGGTTNGAVNIEDISPYDFATIYNVLPLWNAATPIDGTGQTIAIAGTSKINLADVTTFRTAFNLLPNTISLTQTVANGTDPGVCTAATGNCTINDLYENTLDVEWSTSIAKSAKIILVVAGANATTTDTLFAAENYIVQNDLAPIMNVSYGECELGLGTAGNTSYNNLWSTAQGAGIAAFVATGDSGAASCDAGSSPVNGPYGAQFGLSVSGIASTPFNTAVGGTDFNWDSAQATYWATSNNATNLSSALGYIPETPWNSTCTNPLLVTALNSANTLNLTATEWCDDIGTQFYTFGTSEQAVLDFVNTVGAGGGASNCIDGDGATVASCTKAYPKPAWQTGVTGIPKDSARDIPDVSFFASSGFNGSAYVICVSEGGACTYNATTEPTAQEVGGTSVASPIMAGVMALVNQKAGSAQGNPNAQLYKLASKQTYSACSAEAIPLTGSSCVFNDIDTGTITMPCQVGSTTDCSGTDVYGILTGYSATAGYDPASGLGSLNVANFVNAYAASAPTPVTSLTPTSLTFPSTTVGVADPSQTVTLKNTGGADLSITGITITGTDASSFKETDTCGNTVGAAGSCVITVTFKPVVAGATLSATLNIADNASGSPQTIPLSGSTPAPAVTLSPTSLTFASTLVGVTTTPQVVTLKNTGTADLVITTIVETQTIPVQSYFETDTCQGTTVHAGSTCTISVTFKPAQAGSIPATLNIHDNASNTPQVVTLTGSGIAPAPVVSLSATSLTFPTTLIGVTSASQVVTVKNTGTATLTVTGVTLTGANPSSYQDVSNCTSVAINGTCTITVKFQPAATGTLTASITIADNAADTPQKVTLTGTGMTPAPVVSLSALTLTFPSTVRGVAAPTQSVTITNVGTAPLIIASSTVTNAQTGQNYVASTPCGTVAVGGTCVSTVTFKPTAFGTLTATLSFADNAATSPQVVNLTGVGAETGSFTLTATAVTVAPGSNGTSTISATGANGYNGSPITLSACINVTAPSGAVDIPTCAVTAGSVTAGANPTTGTLTFGTVAAGAAVKHAQNEKPHSGRWAGAGGITIAGLFLLFGIPARSRKWRSVLGVFLCLAALGVLSGCGGGSSPPPNPGTTPGNYTYQVTGTDADQKVQTATITVTVS